MRNKLAIVAIAILAVPLALYFVPYSFAATSSTYLVTTTFSVSGPGTGDGTASCNSGDYATGGGYGQIGAASSVEDFLPTPSVSGDEPTGYYLQVSTTGTFSFSVWAICQTPIAVAGIGVPEFGQLYIAIALGALVFYLMGRYMSRNKVTSVAPPSSKIQ